MINKGVVVNKRVLVKKGVLVDKGVLDDKGVSLRPRFDVTSTSLRPQMMAVTAVATAATDVATVS